VKRIQKRIIFLVILLMMANGTFYAALADHDGHKEKKWYKKIFDWDDDDDHDRGKKGGDIKKGTEITPSIMGSVI